MLYIILGLLAALLLFLAGRTVFVCKVYGKRDVTSIPTNYASADAYAGGLQKMIRCKTVSVKDSYDDTEFAKLRDVVKAQFPLVWEKAERHTFSDDCWIWKLPGKDTSRNIMLMSHHDVVDVDDKWTKEPFGGEVAEGKLWGRGTADTKTPLFAELTAMEALLAQGFEPVCNVWIGSSHNEELAGDGIPKALAWFREQDITFETILDEGGAVISPVMGGMRCGMNAAIAVHEKGRYYLDCKAEASSTHVSLSAADLASPVERMSCFLREVTSNKHYIRRLNPQVQAMFTHLAPHCCFPLNVIFSNLWLFGGLLKQIMPKLNPQAGGMIGTFASCNKVSGTSTLCTSEVWLRYVSEEDGNRDLETVRQLASRYNITVEINPRSEYHAPADLTRPQFSYLKDCIAAIFPEYPPIPVILPAGTDARTLTDICPCVLRFAPIRLDKQQFSAIHGADENIDISSIAEAVTFYKYFVEHYQ